MYMHLYIYFICARKQDLKNTRYQFFNKRKPVKNLTYSYLLLGRAKGLCRKGCWRLGRKRVGSVHGWTMCDAQRNHAQTKTTHRTITGLAADGQLDKIRCVMMWQRDRRSGHTWVLSMSMPAVERWSRAYTPKTIELTRFKTRLQS